MKKSKKNKVNNKWYVLVAIALIVGAIIGYLATTNLSVTGKARTALTDRSLQSANTRGTVEDCCKGSTPGGSTYPPGISEGCCLLIDLGLDSSTEISELSDNSDCCTNEAWDEACCNEKFRKLIALVN